MRASNAFTERIIKELRGRNPISLICDPSNLVGLFLEHHPELTDLVVNTAPDAHRKEYVVRKMLFESFKANCRSEQEAQLLLNHYFLTPLFNSIQSEFGLDPDGAQAIHSINFGKNKIPGLDEPNCSLDPTKNSIGMELRYFLIWAIDNKLIRGAYKIRPFQFSNRANVIEDALPTIERNPEPNFGRVIFHGDDSYLPKFDQIGESFNPKSGTYHSVHPSKDNSALIICLQGKRPHQSKLTPGKHHRFDREQVQIVIDNPIFKN